jgi:hypothetical protein
MVTGSPYSLQGEGACRVKKGLTVHCVVQWVCCDYQVDILTRCKTIRTKKELRLQRY